jgi:hypothetical protein
MNLMSAAVYGRRALSARARAIPALSVETLRNSGADAGSGAGSGAGFCADAVPEDAHADIETTAAAALSSVV